MNQVATPKFKTVNIKGTEYVTVSERLKYFRNKYSNFSLTSEITHLNENGVVVRASIKNRDGFELATGIAHETKGSSFINKTSFIENCETSAWGRALSNLGIGIDDSVASADEVANAIKNQ
jgi:hypothetical protein